MKKKIKTEKALDFKMHGLDKSDSFKTLTLIQLFHFIMLALLN